MATSPVRLRLSNSFVSIGSMLLLATAAVVDSGPPQDADPPPTLSIADARVVEGQSGTSALVFTARLSDRPGGIATVDFATVDGSAQVGDQDFEPASGTLTFYATDTVATIAVTVRGDAKIEGNEWFLVRLSNPNGITLTDPDAVGRITNDERPVFTHRWMNYTPYTVGTLPTAWGDYNRDGYQDVPLIWGGPTIPNAEMSGFRAILADGNYHGASSCDYDRDGDLDLVILGYALGERITPDLFLRNRGNGTFESIAPQLGISWSGNGETAVWGDFDGDGWPDLFAPYYTDIFPFKSFLYRNNGDGTFTERAAEAGVNGPNTPWTLRPEGAHAADWNDDGHLDLYCAGHLFVNDGTGHFTDVLGSVGVPAMFDEGASFVDYDNDGDLDLYVRAVDSPHLYRNDSGRFTDVTATAGVTGVPYFWGDSWADADNDGDMDLVQHGGRARLLLNQGDGTFLRDPGFEQVASTDELSAWADADNDGDLDVAIGPMAKQLLTNRLDQQPGFSTSRLRVTVLDAEGHMTCHGATVRLKETGGVPGTIQTRIVDGGSGYLSQNEYTVHFGGVGTGHYELEVVYPSPAGSRIAVDGRSDARLGSLAPGLTPGMAITVYKDGRVEITTGPVAAAPIPPPADSRHRMEMPSPNPARRTVAIGFTLGEPGEVALDVHDLRGRLVRRFDAGSLPAGPRSFTWDLTDDHGSAAGNGVYFIRMVVNGQPAGTRPLLILR